MLLVHVSPNGRSISVHSIDLNTQSADSIAEFAGTWIYNSWSPAFLCAHLMLGARSSIRHQRLLASVSDFVGAADVLAVRAGGLTGTQLHSLFSSSSGKGDSGSTAQVEAANECLRDWPTQTEKPQARNFEALNAQIEVAAWETESMEVTGRVPTSETLCAHRSSDLLLFAHVPTPTAAAVGGTSSSDAGRSNAQPQVTLHMPIPQVQNNQLMITTDSSRDLRLTIALYQMERNSNELSCAFVQNIVCKLVFL